MATKRTKDGYQWSEETGLVQGIPCEGAMESTPPKTTEFDVVVVGAGFAGVTAARDLAVRGKKVLLIEARDRIGGRAWTSTINGIDFEMGGGWLHWNHAHVQSTLTRYGMKDEWISVVDQSGGGVNRCDTILDGIRKETPHMAVRPTFAKAFSTFFNIDGFDARLTLPTPHNPTLLHSKFVQMDNLSASQRLADISPQLSPDETMLLKAFIEQIGGGTQENVGFYDLLRWWCLAGFSPASIREMGYLFKLRHGTTGLCRALFDDAMSTGNLSTLFSTHAVEMHSDKGWTHVHTTDHAEGNGLKQDWWAARKVVCTLPLNVLYKCAFDPPLPALKLEASRAGHINKSFKIHAEVAGTDMNSWTSVMYPSNGINHGYSDGVSDHGTTHITLFGGVVNQMHPQDDVERAKNAIREHRDVDIKRMVWHDWERDPLTKGAWCMFPPGFAQKYEAELKKPAGNIYFASSDWADGWRGWIDGAIEQGALAAQQVAVALQNEDATAV